jgi:serine-type D-Ala-D-Ala carboxypeptidase/endopeptidase (penicillin-binding protein 4)
MNYEFKTAKSAGHSGSKLIRFIIINSTFIIFLTSCSLQKQIAKSAKENVLTAPALQTAHVGISIYEPATNKYWYDYQGEHYFVPASNTKIPTCYAAMKYLGDSLVGARIEERGNTVSIYGTADPTFLHPDFTYQPVLEYTRSKKGMKVMLIRNADSSYNTRNTFTPYGAGWSWADYDESYMPERSFFPIHGNIVTFSIDDSNKLVANPAYFRNTVWFRPNDTMKLKITRDVEQNMFIAEGSAKSSTPVDIPFQTFDFFKGYMGDEKIYKTPDGLFSDIVGYPVIQADAGWQHKDYYKAIHSQSTDSLLKLMMHRSDNFFAEQSLLMVSNEKIGYMNDSKIIDALLKTDFKDLPQKPRWVDGSGLSRYNLFTPQDFVAILNKMKNEFGMERIKVIFPTGGEGTISSYYKTESGYIFVKTGTLSGVVALSGFLYTKKNKLLIFSALVNNHQASATDVRRAVEKFLQGIRNKY